jgi:ATP-dependent RNA helicase RhlB
LIQIIQEFFQRIKTLFIGPSQSFKDIANKAKSKSLPSDDLVYDQKKAGPKQPPKADQSPRSCSRKLPKNRPAEPGWDPSEFSVPSQEGKVRFHDLDLSIEIMHAIFDLGFTYCTPIQAEILPSTLIGKDAYGQAQTGTGKTAAFLITALKHICAVKDLKERKKGTPKVLILAPTRELVLQIAQETEQLAKYLSASIIKIFGGMDYEKQRRQLSNKPVDIVVATPGRLLDFKRRKDVDLKKIEILVIDEADRMLDMGFIPDVRKIVYSTPHKSQRQTMLFSATLTDAVKRLSDQWTRNPVSVRIEPEQVTVDSIEQKIYVVTSAEKFALLYNIITQQDLDRILVFCNRRDETRRLAKMLNTYRINCAILSGEIPQKKRIRTLEAFKSGRIRVLVATDVAGRGIHIDNMSHVINFALPRDPEDYVHRIGRTGRAGARGTSVSFACEDDSFYIPAIEAFIGHKLSCDHPPQKWLELPPKPKKRDRPRRLRRVEERASRPKNQKKRYHRRSRRHPSSTTP